MKLKESSEVHCSLRLRATFEGLMLIILSEQLQKPMPTFASTIDATTSLKNLVVSMEFVKQFVAELSIRLFTQIWLQFCTIQISRYHMLKALQNTNPTTVTRTLLQNNDIVAKHVGDGILYMWQCTGLQKNRPG